MPSDVKTFLPAIVNSMLSSDRLFPHNILKQISCSAIPWSEKFLGVRGVHYVTNVPLLEIYEALVHAHTHAR